LSHRLVEKRDLTHCRGTNFYWELQARDPHWEEMGCWEEWILV
jgi:hypothetical protein